MHVHQDLSAKTVSDEISPDAASDDQSRIAHANPAVFVGDVGSPSVPFAANAVAPGTLFATSRGAVPAETIRPGDMLETDRGAQPVRWVGHLRLKAASCLQDGACPVRIGVGALGQGMPFRDLVVSPGQRILLSGARIERLCGAPAAFVRAGDLLHLDGVESVRTSWAIYVCLLFDTQEVLDVAGARFGSFRPDRDAARSLSAKLTASMLCTVPRLRYEPGAASYVAPYPSLNAREARLVL